MDSIKTKILTRETVNFQEIKADAAFCFGRFNPVHQGHIAAWETVKNSGNIWAVGTNAKTLGFTDPLPFEEKVKWMTALYPEIKNHIYSEQSVLTMASRMYSEANDHKTLAYITDSIDWEWSGKLLFDYNGKVGQHGYYNFEHISHVQSPRISSATLLREAVKNKNKKLFYKVSGTSPSIKVNGVSYFDTISNALQACAPKNSKSKNASKLN